MVSVPGAEVDIESLTAASPLIGIVVVNWKSPADTLRCLAAVQSSNYNNYHIVVVENGSRDDSVSILCQTYPKLDLLVSPENLGYTGGNNLGIRHMLDLGVDYVFLLNDDAVLAPNALEMLAKAAAANPQAGFIGPKILALEERRILLSAGGLLEKGYLPHNRGMGEIDRGQYDHDYTDRNFQADFLSGCALLVSCKLIQQIGLLDDDFFAYFEEVEWCRRGTLAGYTTLFVPEACVWHPDTRTRDNNSPAVIYYTTRNSLLFSQKHQLGWKVKGTLLGEYCRRWLSWSLRPKWRRKHGPAQRQALRQAIVDFGLGRFGRRQ